MIEIRPAYIGKASPAEIEHFAEFIDSLAVLARHIERPLDEPPRPPTRDPSNSAIPPNSAVPRLGTPADPAVVRYCLKVGLCVVLCYIIGLIIGRADLFTILVTVISIATPTYGATLHKMYLRMAGFVIGGAVSLLAIIIISPNFDTLPAYMLVTFAVFYPFAYSSLGNARMFYAGKQMGIIFSLVFVGLSPSVNIYGPLWRIWGVLLGISSWRSSSLPCGRNTLVLPCCPDCGKSLPICSHSRQAARLRTLRVKSRRRTRKRCAC